MAFLIKQRDYYYLQFFDVSRHPTRKRVALKTTHRRTALNQKAELEAAYLHGEYDPWRAIRSGRLGEALDVFMEEKKNLRRTTRDHYRWVLGSLCKYLGPDFPMQQLDWMCIQRWLDSTTGNDQSRYTYLTRVGIFVRYLMREGILDEDLSKSVPIPRPPQRLAEKLLTEDQLQVLVRVARESGAPYIAAVHC